MKVLIIDDDPHVVDAVAVAVQFHWQDVVVLTANNGEQGLQLFYDNDPDVVVLDVSMPGKTGFEVVQEIRRTSDVPVIMLTARDKDTDQVRGLELGADDYVLKPFSHLTLLARIKAVVRRAKLPPPSRTLPDFVAGELSINFESQEVRLRGELVPLTPVEYKLLYHLVRNAGRLMPHQALLERVWGSEWGATSNNLKALVSRLRRKIEPDGTGLHFLENARGAGYRFIRPASAESGPIGQKASG